MAILYGASKGHYQISGASLFAMSDASPAKPAIVIDPRPRTYLDDLDSFDAEPAGLTAEELTTLRVVATQRHLMSPLKFILRTSDHEARFQFYYVDGNRNFELTLPRNGQRPNTRSLPSMPGG